MVDATNGVGPLGNQQFSTKGIKLSDLKEKNQLLFDYFKQAGLNENSYVYSTDIEKLKEAYDKNDNGKLSKKEARAIFGDDVSRRDIKRAIKAMDEILTTDLEGDGQYPVKVSDNETQYYSKDNKLIGAVCQDKDLQISELYGPNNEITNQFVQRKNEDGSYSPVSHTVNEYNEDGTLYKRQDRLFGDGDEFKETQTTFLNGDENKPVKIEENINGNKKTTDIEYNNEGKRIRSIISEAGQKTEIAYDQQERPMKQFVKPNGSDSMTIHEYKYDGVSETPSEILTTNPDGTQTRVTYRDGKFVSREEIVKLNPEDVIAKRKEANPPKAKVTPKVHVPDDWGRVPTSFRHTSGIMEAKDADAALKVLLDARNIKAADVDADKLKADLIKYNPSLFDKDGKVKNNAKWDRLDLPNNIKAQYGKALAGTEDEKSGEPAPRGYVPIDPSLPGIPDPRARFNPRENFGKGIADNNSPNVKRNERQIAAEQEQKKLLEEQAKVQKAIPELIGQVSVTRSDDGKILYKPLTGPLAGREYTSVDDLKVALEFAKKGYTFPQKNE